MEPHRALFAFITGNWRGKPLVSHAVIVQLIAATKTKAGLEVRCELDPNTYPAGVKVSDVSSLSKLYAMTSTVNGTTRFTHKPKFHAIVRARVLRYFQSPPPRHLQSTVDPYLITDALPRNGDHASTGAATGKEIDRRTRDDVAGDPHKLAFKMPNAEALDIPCLDHNLGGGDKVHNAGVLAFLERRP